MHRITIALAFFLLAVVPAFGEGGKIIMTTSDYVSGNTAMYDIDAGKLTDNLLGHFQDAYVRTHGNKVYIIEGGDNSSIMKFDLNSPGKPLWQYSVGAGSNPHDLVFVPTDKYLKGYVLRYNKTALWVVNLDAPKTADFKLGEIDLSAWKDADGSPEAHLGFFHNGYVWIVLQRYSLSDFTAGTAALLKIDPVTDTVVDLDPATAGLQGVNLIRKNPVAGSLISGMLFLAGTTYGASDEGVWSVDLSDPVNGQKAVLTEKTLGSSAAGLYVANSTYGVVTTFDASWNAVPRPFNPATGAFLDPLPVADAGGGMASVNGILYVGSRDKTKPALYAVDPGTNKVIAGPFPTSLPPLTIAYAGEPEKTAAAEIPPIPFALNRAYPNPFNPETMLSFTLDRGMRISLTTYTVTGQKAAEPASGFFPAGAHSIKWDASGLSSGVYCIRLTDGKRAVYTKALMVR
ncbi:MAG: hypothetical protein ACYC9O_01850 [Candidatus Latescibacterota bacterium]